MTMVSNTKEKRSQWHPAFYGAMHLEFMNNKHNLLEFKSPDTSLNYDVFLKGIAYAYLYKANERYVDEILLEDITLSFIRQRKPIKLFKKLQKEHFLIEQKWQGIYCIIKDGFIRIQIIVSKELSSQNHIWLNSLCQKLTIPQTVKLIEKTEKLQQYN